MLLNSELMTNTVKDSKLLEILIQKKKEQFDYDVLPLKYVSTNFQ